MSTLIKETSSAEVDIVMQASLHAFVSYRNSSLLQRAALLRSISAELKQEEELLIEIASQETHLSVWRLKSELIRTCYQLTTFAKTCEEASWMDIRIDTENKSANPVRPDLRKTMVPLGPVVVFGASNFPFAYSTAGGDTTSALAAGCTVVVKAHPAHPLTSERSAACIQRALRTEGLHSDIFQHVTGSSVELAQSLVQHSVTKAVGFTGSFSGGKQMFDWAMQRKDPIPVFAEMGSLNPVFLLPGRLKKNGEAIAEMMADSVLQSSGQFCTKPGLIIGIEGPDFDVFAKALALRFNKEPTSALLHAGIHQRYVELAEGIMSLGKTETLIQHHKAESSGKAVPLFTSVKAADWINEQSMQHEVFGPFTLLIRCRNDQELLNVAAKLEGQLTATIHALDDDLALFHLLSGQLIDKVGRIILNGVPTGVNVAKAMQHGGPFPATTDSRFTAVGPDAIKRFARPVCFQNWNNEWLPYELKNENPLNLLRWVNGGWTRDSI